MFGFAGYAYIGVFAVLLALENRLLFPTSSAREWFDPPSGLTVEDVWLEGGGNRIHAWWAQPSGWTPQRGAILYAHGNGNNLSARGESIRHWRDELGRAVLIYDYPGYGRSSGSPNESSCYAAAEAAYDYVVEQKKTPPREVILLGSSLGGAMAVELATHRPYRMLLLINAFTSFPDMAQKVVPWFPARWLVSNRLDNLSKIKRCAGPIFITHGTADGLVPFSQGERLFAAAEQPKRFFRREGDGHRHPEGAAFFQAVRSFLDETAAR
jgi:fermentation-respiration switch protein FrsA (DUF1100 family)